MSDEFYRHLNKSENRFYFMKKWRYPARLCIPILQDLDGRLVQPHIENGYIRNDVYETEPLDKTPSLASLIPIRKKVKQAVMAFVSITNSTGDKGLKTYE